MSNFNSYQPVYKNLVDSLKSIKNERQVIIATHSSTIVTNADSEEVIVMDSDNRNDGLKRKAMQVIKIY